MGDLVSLREVRGQNPAPLEIIDVVKNRLECIAAANAVARIAPNAVLLRFWCGDAVDRTFREYRLIFRAKNASTLHSTKAKTLECTMRLDFKDAVPMRTIQNTSGEHVVQFRISEKGFEWYREFTPITLVSAPERAEETMWEIESWINTYHAAVLELSKP